MGSELCTVKPVKMHELFYGCAGENITGIMILDKQVLRGQNPPTHF